MAVIYIVEDDEALQGELIRLLKLNDYDVASCSDFANASKEVLEIDPDLVILDLNLPGTDGFSICREIRQGSKGVGATNSSENSLSRTCKSSTDSKVADVPIIILTSANDEFSEVMSLNLGAHDFISKPYRPAVLLARIASLIKRHDRLSAKSHTVKYAGVVLDMATSEIEYNGHRAPVTRNEQRILALLMNNPETIISRQEIMCDLWESDAFVDDNTLTVNVNRLRKTLSSIGVPPDYLQTRRSQGYIVVADKSAK